MTDPTRDRPGGRIAVIDVLRGVALVGILLVNIILMGGPIDSYRPAAPASLANSDWVAWWISHLFIYGSMRGLFSILFGASALLFLAAGGREVAFLLRSGWLFCFGALNATLLLWPGDILMIYALVAPLLLLFRQAAPGRLLTIGLALLAVLACWAYLDTLAGTLTPAATRSEALVLEAHARLGGYLANLHFMAHHAAWWMLSAMRLFWLLDAFAFMLIGMALFRLGLLDGAAPAGTYVILLLIGVLIGLPLRFAEALSAWPHDGRFPPLAEASFQVGRLAVSLGWIGAVTLLWRALPWRAAFTPLAALGRMALSGYLAQSAIAALVFSGFGLGLWNQLGWLQRWALALLIMALLAFAARLWLERFAMGPAEWLWRRLTFGWRRRQDQPAPQHGETHRPMDESPCFRRPSS
jgi:uncharacterized protein